MWNRLPTYVINIYNKASSCYVSAPIFTLTISDFVSLVILCSWSSNTCTCTFAETKYGFLFTDHTYESLKEAWYMNIHIIILLLIEKNTYNLQSYVTSLSNCLYLAYFPEVKKTSAKQFCFQLQTNVNVCCGRTNHSRSATYCNFIISLSASK